MTGNLDTGTQADSVCAAAISDACAAAIEVGGPEAVGPHKGIIGEDERLVTHIFACTLPGYVGWAWNVVVSRAPDAGQVTVSEVDLLPTADAILAPDWLPWTERVQAGDLAPGDVVVTDSDDARLAPGWSGEDDLAGEIAPGPLHPVNWEPGLGRMRVPSMIGREEAATRWENGETGPKARIAKNAAGSCSSCGWMLTVGGPIGQAFGACTNMLSPADGRMVSFDHGCGGHSEATLEVARKQESVIVDDHAIDELDMGHS